jgi:transcriptional regulator with XRE-family HTH domain
MSQNDKAMPGGYSLDLLIGSKISRLRWRAGITVAQLARRVAMSTEDIEACEAGTKRASAAQLALIADALDSTMAELFSDIDFARKP